jgi:hypothetical protein
MKNFTILLSALMLTALPFSSFAKPEKSLLDSAVIQDIQNFIQEDIVVMAILNQNSKYKDLDNQAILDLDKKWRAERKSEDQPLIAATLANPLSSYLTRIQAHSIGLYSEMFVMDMHGLNVGQSNITSDYWQGDEAKFKKTYGSGTSRVFIDEPEFDDGLNIWRAQVNMAISDPATSKLVGAVTVELNLTELERRKGQE